MKQVFQSNQLGANQMQVMILNLSQGKILLGTCTHTKTEKSLTIRHQIVLINIKFLISNICTTLQPNPMPVFSEVTAIVFNRTYSQESVHRIVALVRSLVLDQTNEAKAN